jgi:hypothetical protein
MVYNTHISTKVETFLPRVPPSPHPSQALDLITLLIILSICHFTMMSPLPSVCISLTASEVELLLTHLLPFAFLFCCLFLMDI